MKYKSMYREIESSPELEQQLHYRLSKLKEPGNHHFKHTEIEKGDVVVNVSKRTHDGNTYCDFTVFGDDSSRCMMKEWDLGGGKIYREFKVGRELQREFSGFFEVESIGQGAGITDSQYESLCIA